MGAGNDVGCHKAITNTFTGISASAHCSIHRTGLSTHHDGHITTADEFAGHQGDFSCFGHGIGCLDGRHKATGFDHAEGDALH